MLLACGQAALVAASLPQRHLLASGSTGRIGDVYEHACTGASHCATGLRLDAPVTLLAPIGALSVVPASSQLATPASNLALMGSESSRPLFLLRRLHSL